MFRASLMGCLIAVVAMATGPVDPGLAQGAESGGVQFDKRCLLISPNEGCAVGDVNRDGKPDVVAGTCWFAGPDFVPRPLRDIDEFEDDYLCNNGDHLYDVDGDGWLDVISGHWMTPEIYWYKNPGKTALAKGMKWKQHLLKVTRGQNECNVLKDFDGDGVPEWFVNSWDKKAPQVVWKFVRDEQGKPSLERVVLGHQGSGHGYGFGDVNGDGREDILTETGWYERPAKAPLATPWEFHPETALPHPSCPCQIVDLNGDGRNDILWGKAHDFGLYWWEQGEPKPNGTTTWSEHLIDDSWSQVHCIVAADLDGDGKDEFVTGKRVRGHAGRDPGGKDPECLFYYKWNASKQEFVRYAISDFGGGVGTGMQICVAELNGDDRPDVAVSGKSGTWVLLNRGVR